MVVTCGGKGFLLAQGKMPKVQREENYAVMAVDMAPWGQEFGQSRLAWVGNKITINFSEAELFKGGSTTLAFSWDINPIDVEFAPNVSFSPWISGNKAIRAGRITMTPADKKAEFLANEDRNWIYRVVMMAKSYTDLDIAVHALPVAKEQMDGNPWNNSIYSGGICLDSVPATWANPLPQIYDRGFIPFIADLRHTAFKKHTTFPTSQVVRDHVWNMLTLAAQPATVEAGEEYKLGERLEPLWPKFPQIWDEKPVDFRPKTPRMTTDQVATGESAQAPTGSDETPRQTPTGEKESNPTSDSREKRSTPTGE